MNALFDAIIFGVGVTLGWILTSATIVLLVLIISVYLSRE